MTGDSRSDLGRMLKQRRVMIPLTLEELAASADISSSHLGRIERGERYPSARILRRLAKPLNFEEAELMSLAGYLSPEPTTALNNSGCMHLDRNRGQHPAGILSRNVSSCPERGGGNY